MVTRRNRFVLVVLLGALSGMILQGCSSTPRFNDRFGDAVRTNLSAQVLDPAASSNVNPAAGVDGPAALAAHERYQRSFKELDPSASQPLVGNGNR